MSHHAKALYQSQLRAIPRDKYGRFKKFKKDYKRTWNSIAWFTIGLLSGLIALLMFHLSNPCL